MKDFYKRKLFTLLIPLVIYSLIYQIYYNYTNINSLLSFIKSFSFQSILSDQVGNHLWFVYQLTGFYLAAPFLQEMFEGLSKKMLITFLGMVYCFTGIIDYLEMFGIQIAFTSIFRGVFCFYFVLGYVVSRIDIQKYKVPILIIGIINYVVMFCMEYFGLLKQNLYTSSVNMIIGVLFYYVLFLQVRSDWPQWMRKSIIFLSGKTYSIYLIHVLFLSVF